MCTGKGYGKVNFSGLALLASQKWCFFGTFVCTGKGYVERERKERKALFRARFARLSKVVFFLALLCAPVESSKGLVGVKYGCTVVE